MGYLIRMAPEVGVWLAAVRDRDPAAADLIDEAVAALRTGGESVGPPLVVPLEDDPSLNVRPDLDTAYERQLEMLTHVRRAVATVATSRKRLELQANQLEQQIGKLGEQSRRAMEAARGDLAEEAGARRGAVQEQLADLQRQYAGMQAEEGRLTVASQRRASQGGRLPDCARRSSRPPMWRRKQRPRPHGRRRSSTTDPER